MRNSDRTKMGGARSTFQTTQWLEIRELAKLDPDQQRTVLDGLMTKYWKPVYCYLRRKGYDNEAAKDLTQGFFYDIVIGRRLIEQADAAKGRFRTFLLTVLDRYVISMHRRQAAAKRRPAQGVMSLEGADESALPVVAREMQPDEAFTYAWAVELLQEVLADLKDKCVRDGKKVHWELFASRVLDPIITGREAPALAQLCAQFGVTTPVKAENMIVTVKRRFQAALKNRVRQEVDSEEEMERELQDIMRILSR